MGGVPTPGRSAQMPGGGQPQMPRYQSLQDYAQTRMPQSQPRPNFQPTGGGPMGQMFQMSQRRPMPQGPPPGGGGKGPRPMNPGARTMPQRNFQPLPTTRPMGAMSMGGGNRMMR